MAKQNKVRLGMIGVGGISQLVHIPGFLRCKDAQIVAICDVSDELLEKIGDELGVSQRYTDYAKLFDEVQLDAVCVATPNFMHYPIVAEACKRRVNILCEKPIAMDLAEAEKMYGLVKTSGVTNMVAFNYRFVPAIQWLKQLMDADKLGKVYHFRAFYLQEWNSEGASWRTRKHQAGSGESGDVGSHLLDFAHFLIGDIASVCGNTTIFIKRRTVPGTTQREVADVDDAAAFIAEFKNGATGVFEASRFATGRGCGPTECQLIEINGEKGSVLYDYQKPDELKLCLTPKDRAATRFVTKKVPAVIREFYGAAIWREFQASPPCGFRHKQAELFIEAVKAGKKLHPNFADGLKVQRVLEAVLQSSKERRWVDP